MYRTCKRDDSKWLRCIENKSRVNKLPILLLYVNPGATSVVLTVTGLHSEDEINKSGEQGRLSVVGSRRWLDNYYKTVW